VRERLQWKSFVPLHSGTKIATKSATLLLSGVTPKE